MSLSLTHFVSRGVAKNNKVSSVIARREIMCYDKQK